MNLKLITPPTDEPVSLVEVKAHLRITSNLDDGYLPILITAARELVETVTRRQIMTAVWQLGQDSFKTPIAGQYYDAFRVPMPPQAIGATPFGSVSYPYSVIYLPRPPVQSVTSVQYLDTNNVTQTLDPTQYITDFSSEPARIMPPPGVVWPSTRAQINSVTITYTAGYGASRTSVPARFKLAIMQLIGHWFNNRESVTDASLKTVPDSMQRLLGSLDFGSYS
jgi:hypothetical protein